MVVSGTVAPRGNWTVPAVVKDAIAWYDYSDESTIQFDGNDEVSGVLNKAENGSALDAVIFNGDKTVRAWLYSESVGETAKQTAEIAAEGTLDANGTELLYMGYRRQSQGASTGILAEQLVFSKVLTEEELAEVSGYLKGKWYTVPEVDMAPLIASMPFVHQLCEREIALARLGNNYHGVVLIKYSRNLQERTAS